MRMYKRSRLTGVLADIVPNAFSFTDTLNALTNTDYTSNSVTITGITAPAPVSTSGCLVSIAGGAYVSSGTITNGQTLVAKVSSPAAYASIANGVVTVGGVSDTYSVSTLVTAPDATVFVPDANTKLLMQFNGAAGSASFADDMGHTPNITGTGFSLAVDGQFSGCLSYADSNVLSDKILFPAHADFYLGTTYTIEFWIKPDTPVVGSLGGVIDIGVLATRLFARVNFASNTSALTFNCAGDWSSGVPVAITTALTVGSWSHVAIVKQSGVLKSYVNGVLNKSYTGQAVVGGGNNAVVVGSFLNNTGGVRPARARLDGLRLSNIARYTANFTVPVANT